MTTIHSSYHDELAAAKAIALEAGDIMRQYFDGDQQRVVKQDGTPLTIADTMINRLVIERLQSLFPGDGIIGEEESTTEYGRGRKWLCDPIDGTKAFTWGVPTAMFSLALAIDGIPVMGVCYEPMLDRLYWAVDGQGAFCNDEPIRVNEQTLSDGILAISSQPRDFIDKPVMQTIAKSTITTAVFSGAVFKAIMVAAGRYVGYIDTKVGPHDMAAIDCIIREANGVITGLDGNPLRYDGIFKGAIVSNGIVHADILKLGKH